LKQIPDSNEPEGFRLEPESALEAEALERIDQLERDAMKCRGAVHAKGATNLATTTDPATPDAMAALRALANHLYWQAQDLHDDYEGKQRDADALAALVRASLHMPAAAVRGLEYLIAHAKDEPDQ
jgi:hypothetical protein